MVLWGLTGCEQPAGLSPVKEPEREEERQGEAPPPPQTSPEAKLTGIIISSPPETLFYAIGQNFDTAGLIVEGVYGDDTSRELEAHEYTLGRVDTTLPGPQRVRVSAGAFSASFPIMVNNSDSVLNSIDVKAPEGGVVRYLGQTLGTEGFTVTGHYTEGDRELSMFSVRGYDRTKRGAQTVTLSVNGKSAELPITVKVPANAMVYAAVLGTDSGNPKNGHNNVFIKGQPLSLANPRFYATVSCNKVTAVLVSGDGIEETDLSRFDGDKAGKQRITLSLDEKSIDLDVYVADREPQVYFDYGFMRTTTDPNGWGLGRTEGCYHTQPGKTLVLSPVRVLIGYNQDNKDIGVTYSWTIKPVGATSASYTASPLDGEFLRFTPTAGGSWDVSVTVSGRNFVDGSTISRSTKTTVICDAGPLPSGSFPLTKHFSPGQFTESGTGYGWSLGTFGGYLIKPVSHKAQYTIEGNAFGSWEEPGVVWFQEDLNGNGLPDEIWYELNVGSDPTITRRYSLAFFKYGDGSSRNEYGQIIREIYWVDSKGRTGQINGGWPTDWGVSNVDGAWVTYTGTLVGDDNDIRNVQIRYPTGWTNCVDSAQTVFPISGAIAADGSAVTLTKVAFVKVQTAAFKYGGTLGELSTEIEKIEGAW